MSAIYTGWVGHNRPGKHRLRYSMFMLALDLDELPRLKLRLLGHNRLRLMSVFDRDHGARIDAPLRPQIEAKLRGAGIAWDGGRIVLLTMPRLLNYVFNPLSVYFCWRRDGELAALVHEVSNTFGERHFYVLPPTGAANGAITQACAKRFFVSPFLEGGLVYEFRVRPPGDETAIGIVARRGRSVALTASFAGKRSPLTDANLLRAWLGNPLLTLKVIAGIHWEALKMWLKGVRYVGRHGQRPVYCEKVGAHWVSSSFRGSPAFDAGENPEPRGRQLKRGVRCVERTARWPLGSGLGSATSAEPPRNDEQ